jgi:hypothetical protein
VLATVLKHPSVAVGQSAPIQVLFDGETHS